MTAPAEVGVRRSGRRRSPAADTAILDATVDLLREVGYEALTMSAVIERSGVSSATLYRRWSTKPELVVAAVTTLAPEPVDIDTGSLRRDLALLVRTVAASVDKRDERVAETMAHAARLDPQLSAALEERFVRPRRTQLAAMLDRAVARGELAARPSAEFAHSLVVGPLFHRALLLRQPLTPAFVRVATAHVLAGLGLDGEGEGEDPGVGERDGGRAPTPGP